MEGNGDEADDEAKEEGDEDNADTLVDEAFPPQGLFILFIVFITTSITHLISIAAVPPPIVNENAKKEAKADVMTGIVSFHPSFSLSYMTFK